MENCGWQMTVDTQALVPHAPAAVAEGMWVRFAARNLSRMHRSLNAVVDRLFALDLRPEEIDAMTRPKTRID